MRVDDEAKDVHGVTVVHLERLVKTGGTRGNCNYFIIRASKNRAGVPRRHCRSA